MKINVHVNFFFLTDTLWELLEKVWGFFLVVRSDKPTHTIIRSHKNTLK